MTDQLTEQVRFVLNRKAREGKTTKRDAVLLVLGRIEKMGGPTKIGLGAAALRWALSRVVEDEVSRQLKQPLTEHEYLHRMPSSTPMEVIAALGKTPRWIAIAEGPEAEWLFSLEASPEAWMLNAQMKEKKARQTQAKARESADIALFLTSHKFANLNEALERGV